MANPKRRDNINVVQDVLIRHVTKSIQTVIKLENSSIVFQEILTKMRLLTKIVLTTPFAFAYTEYHTERCGPYPFPFFSFLETRGIRKLSYSLI